jgi:DNA repair protein RecO (recombination protein O)
MNILELTTADHSSDKLSRLNEYSLSKVYQNIPFDVLRSSIGIFTLELSRNAIQEKESNEELFDFLYSWFTYLDVENVFYPLAHLKFMTELSKHLGFAPLENYNESRTIFDLLDGEFVDIESNKYHLNHELSHYLFQLLSVSFEDLKDLEIPKAIRKKLINVLLDYYALHLPTFKELKSHKVLEELLN